jgi:drug/metabolite transporter (DMT)-like permease
MAAQASNPESTYLSTVLQALLVTFLWSTSWVLIKIGLDEIPALTFAGLRYTLGFLCLLPLFFRSRGLSTLRNLSPAAWRQLLILGVVYYALNHGAQFISIDLLPAVTANLVLNFTPVVVALLGILLLAERPLPLQWIGIGISILGIGIYFYPVQLPTSQLIGLVVAIIGMLTNASSAILGRSINRTKTLSPLLITTVSMGIGGLSLLGSGILTSGLPVLTVKSWLIVAWLAVVNTAFTFTLWNHTLRTLSAMESSMLNSTMAVQIPILAVLLLGERLTGRELVGLVVAIVGVFVVQLARMWVARGK